MRQTAIIRYLVLAVGVAACGGRTPPPGSLGGNPFSADTTGALAVRPGDVIRVQVFGRESSTAEYPIDENFNLVLPFTELNVRDLTVQDLRARIRQQYGQLYTTAFVAVTPLFRLAILGEVQRPGLYSADPTFTVYDLIALAGGPSRAANPHRITLVREGQQYRVSLAAAALASATLRELGVRSGDQVVVPRRSITRDDGLLVLSTLNTLLLAYSLLR